MSMAEPKSSQSGSVLIVGGGITGLTLAALLEERGIVPEVVEKMPNFTKAGYGITIMPAGMAVLRRLELVGAMRKEGTSSDDFHFLTPEGKMIRTIQLENAGVDSITLHRGDLHRALRKKLKATQVRLGTTITALHQAKKAVKVTFNDGAVGT